MENRVLEVERLAGLSCNMFLICLWNCVLHLDEHDFAINLHKMMRIDNTLVFALKSKLQYNSSESKPTTPPLNNRSTKQTLSLIPDAQVLEVSSCLWNSIRKQLEGDPASTLSGDRYVEENLVVERLAGSQHLGLC